MGLSAEQLKASLDALAEIEPVFAEAIARAGYPEPRIRDRGYEIEECAFVVLDPFREQHRPCLIDHDAMMSSFARVDSYPECRHIQSPSISSNFRLALSITTPARPYPTINVVILNQRSSHRRAAGGHSQ